MTDLVRRTGNDPRLGPTAHGCGRTGTPDRNDWIIDCAAQAQIEELLRQAIAVLGDPGANR